MAESGGGSTYRNALASLVVRVVQDSDSPPCSTASSTRATRGRLERSIEERAHELRSQGELPGDIDSGPALARGARRALRAGAIGPLLVDSGVSEIIATRFDAILAVRAGRHVPVTPGFSSEEAMRRAAWVVPRRGPAAGLGRDQRGASPAGRVTPVGRGRCGGAGGPAGDSARRGVGASFELVRSGTISRAIATFLGHAVAARLYVLVVARAIWAPAPWSPRWRLPRRIRGKPCCSTSTTSPRRPRA